MAVTNNTDRTIQITDIRLFFLCTFSYCGHARQQCTLAGRVRHARTCLHTHDAALCAGHEQQPERGDEQCEGTSGMVNMQPAHH